jgi:hypothetical protein
VDPKEELEAHQRAGRERERTKAWHRVAATAYGFVAFMLVFVPLVAFELKVMNALPFLQPLGRLVLVLFAGFAGAVAGPVYWYAGGKELKQIRDWERKRDDW